MHTHTSDCNAEDLVEIDCLVLGNANCVTPNFTTTPWNDCILVTSQNAVQMQAHLLHAHQLHYIIHAVMLRPGVGSNLVLSSAKVVLLTLV